jgi:hypothetical protein
LFSSLIAADIQSFRQVTTIILIYLGAGRSNILLFCLTIGLFPESLVDLNSLGAFDVRKKMNSIFLLVYYT